MEKRKICEYEIYGAMGDDPEYHQEIKRFSSDKNAKAYADKTFGVGKNSVYKYSKRRKAWIRAD